MQSRLRCRHARHVFMASRRLMEDFDRWRTAGWIDAGQSIIDVAFFVRVHLFHFTIKETISNRPNSVSKSYIRSSKRDDSVEGRCIAVITKRNRRPSCTRVISMVAATIAKKVSDATAWRRLRMHGLYKRIPLVCIPSTVQSRKARLKWCFQHVICIVTDWGHRWVQICPAARW